MVVVDMPFMSYQLGVDEGFRNAGRIMKETSASAVKLEGGERVAETIRKITEAGIPVMGHIGLTPQSIHQFGSYRERGRDKGEAEEILKDAKILEEAGAFAIVLEKIPAYSCKAGYRFSFNSYNWNWCRVLIVTDRYLLLLICSD
jgi:3-methyl-2-oxobutanoate hydroxymethyltransferase